MSYHGWLESSPLKHIVLRLLSFVLGYRLIPFLKKVAILDTKYSGIKFSREITLQTDKVVIKDNFKVSGVDADLYPAPSYSLRHVPSAYRFTTEELILPTEIMLSKDKNGYYTSSHEISL